jgi:hypothetical protein
MNFFRLGAAKDPIYCTLRDGTDDRHFRGRKRLEDLWQACAQYVDLNAAEKAMNRLVSVFWELHLANALVSAGKWVVPRDQLGYHKNKGPDLFIRGTPEVWIEAIAVTPGSGDDRLQSAETGDYDPDGVVLRLRSAIQDKIQKIEGYIADGIIKPNQSIIIAISGVELPYRNSGRTPSEIVRSVYPVNNAVLEFNRMTATVTERHLEFRDHIIKVNNAEVFTNVFSNMKNSCISAVLFDESDWINYPDPPGADFKLAHNTHAAVPIPSGWFSQGREYWCHNGSLESRDRGQFYP